MSTTAGIAGSGLSSTATHATAARSFDCDVVPLVDSETGKALNPSAVNNLGTVAGLDTSFPANQTAAYIWKAGHLTLVRQSDVALYGIDINDAEQVVSYEGLNVKAEIWQAGVAKVLPGMQTVTSINNLGDVLGECDAGHRWAPSGGDPVVLGTNRNQAWLALNDHRLFAGKGGRQDGFAARYRNGRTKLLKKFGPGSAFTLINNHAEGVVVKGYGGGYVVGPAIRLQSA